MFFTGAGSPAPVFFSRLYFNDWIFIRIYDIHLIYHI